MRIADTFRTINVRYANAQGEFAGPAPLDQLRVVLLYYLSVDLLAWLPVETL